MKPSHALNKQLLILVYISFILVINSSAQTIDFGKCYYNISKGSTGGAVETGDILEIRSTITIKAGIFDSCAFFDNIPAGTSFVSGSIRVLTNEGQIYKQFTDARDSDCGWINGSAIRINLGYSSINAATFYQRGRIVSTHKPSLYGSSCIMVAAYRVTVTAASNNTINLGGGYFSYQTGLSAVQNFTLPPNNVRVYPNYGNSFLTTGTNLLTSETSGSFSNGKSRNRGTSSAVTSAFSVQPLDIGSPYDNSYAIVNNSSTRSNYSTTNTWTKPDNSAPTHRVFGVWDIIGDHTNAASSFGNPASDTVASNTGGYMLTVNGAFRSDSVLQIAVSGLCANTAYEISAWFRNMCSKCGCDSNGTGATVSTGPPYYIPTAIGDSSGVHPNVSFEINGVDYYSTGNMPYTGQWVRKSFTYMTGTGQTNFTMEIVNNATGGGGNDWAIDDLSVLAILPDMNYAPSANTTLCEGNALTIDATVTQSFNGYPYYIWQRSTNNGGSWNNIGTGTGPELQIQNGANWEYTTSYTLPPTATQLADSGDQYRLLVAGSLTNLSNSGCRFTEQNSVLTLHVIDCGIPLSDHKINFTGRYYQGQANLQWTTSQDQSLVAFEIERSTNAYDYSAIGIVKSLIDNESQHTYQYFDKILPGQSYYYRLRVREETGKYSYSNTIHLSSPVKDFDWVRVVNPFHDKISLEVSATRMSNGELLVMDATGIILKRKIVKLNPGINNLRIENTGSLPAGTYFITLISTEGRLHRTLIKNHN